MTGKILLCLLLLVCGSACQKRTVPLQDYVAWLHDPDHGTVQSKRVGGLQISVKYVPPEYSVYRQIREDPALALQRDSLIAEQQKSMTFLLSLAPDSTIGARGNITMRGISSYQEFAERVMLFNFHMDEYLRLGVGSKRYEPVLTSLDNTYGLNKSTLFTVVYPSPKNSKVSDRQEDITFTWNDMIFSTGIHHFVFRKEDLENIPTLQF